MMGLLLRMLQANGELLFPGNQLWAATTAFVAVISHAFLRFPFALRRVHSALSYVVSTFFFIMCHALSYFASSLRWESVTYITLLETTSGTFLYLTSLLSISNGLFTIVT